MSENKMATKEDLKEFYNRIYPYLGGSAAAGFTPIGTIIPMIAETAPANYLICDGTAYNKSDYPELAVHLLAMTNHSMYEVSGDSTKFKVPDLRGEFMRMTGTNSHENQGSGAAVGVHQDATQHFRIGGGSNNDLYFYPNGISWTTDIKSDSASTASSNTIRKAAASNSDAQNASTYYTSRPTNTSVLFCIATKNIYLNPSLDYSTDEKVVGTWIDGKTLYQRTLDLTISTVGANTIAHNIANVDTIMFEPSSSYVKVGTEFFALSAVYVSYTTDDIIERLKNFSLIFNWANSTSFNILAGSSRLGSGKITFRYTKTTS